MCNMTTELPFFIGLAVLIIGVGVASYCFGRADGILKGH